MERADEMIHAYMPFIRSETSKFLGRVSSEHDDETSIAMIAFHEAIRKYASGRGSFISFAALLIRSRLIDYQRTERRHRGHLSMDEEINDGDGTLGDTIAAEGDPIHEGFSRAATLDEIQELGRMLQDFGLSYTDIAENSPKQARTLETCRRALRYAVEERSVIEELLRTKKLPLAQLVRGADVERKTLERHRKYLIAMLLIQSNGYEILRGHLHRIIRVKEGANR